MPAVATVSTASALLHDVGLVRAFGCYLQTVLYECLWTLLGSGVRLVLVWLLVSPIRVAKTSFPHVFHEGPLAHKL